MNKLALLTKPDLLILKLHYKEVIKEIECNIETLIDNDFSAYSIKSVKHEKKEVQEILRVIRILLIQTKYETIPKLQNRHVDSDAK